MDELGGSALALLLSEIGGKSVSDGTATTNLSDDTDSFVFNISGIGRDAGSITLRNGEESFSFNVEHTGTGVRFTNVSGSDKFTLLDTEVAGEKGESVAVKVKYVRSEAESNGREGDTYDFTLSAKDTEGAAISVGQHTLSLATSMDELGSSNLALSLFAIDDVLATASTKLTSLSDTASSFTFALSGIGKDAKTTTISDGDEDFTFAVTVTGPKVVLTPMSNSSSKFTLEEVDSEVFGEKNGCVTAHLKYIRSDSEQQCLSDDHYIFKISGTDLNDDVFAISNSQLILETKNNTSGVATLPLSNLSLALLKVGDFDYSQSETNIDDTAESFTLRISGLGRDAGEVTVSDGSEIFTFVTTVTGTKMTLEALNELDSHKFAFKQQNLELNGSSSKTVDVDLVYTRNDDEKSGQNSDTYNFTLIAKNQEGKILPIETGNLSLTTEIDSTTVNEDWVVENNQIVYQGAALSSTDTINIKLRSDGQVEIDGKYVEDSVATIKLSDEKLSETNITISGKAGVGLGSSTEALTIDFSGPAMPSLTSLFLTNNKEDNLVLKNVSTNDVDKVAVTGTLEYGGANRASDTIKGTFTLNDNLDVFNSSITMRDASTLSIISYGTGSKLVGSFENLDVSNIFINGGIYFDIIDLDLTGVDALTISGDMNLSLLDSQLPEFTTITSVGTGSKNIIVYDCNKNLATEISFTDNTFNFSDFSGFIETGSKAKFFISGENTSVDLGKATLTSLATINLGGSESEDDGEKQTITLNQNTLKNVTTITADSEDDTVFLSEAVGQSGLSFVVKFTSNENGILQLATAGEAGNVLHNYLRIADGVQTQMHIKAGNHGDRLEGGTGYNVFTLGNGEDTFRSNVKSTTNADILYNFDSQSDKFNYYGSLNNGNNTSISNNTISGGGSLEEAISAKTDALVYIINSNNEQLISAIDNFIEDKATVSELLANSIDALGSLSGLDAAVGGNESVLVAVNADNSGGAVVLALSNTEIVTQDTIGQNEVQLVAVLDDAAINAANFS
ncbi:MAG: hypothetical protein K6G15_00430 [Desulfovibrio sp.]|nr:hypothetical protein [Desulfovibrio sp.]